MSEAHMKAINGFPNMFFGWGGEDDNLYQRLVVYTFTPYNINVK